MPDQQVFRLRWRGSSSGPHNVEQLKGMLAGGAISLMHEVEVKGRWLSLEEFLANVSKEKSESITRTDLQGTPQMRSVGDRVPPARDEQFYVARSGRQQGPYSTSVLRELAAAGFLSAEDLAWKEGMQEWMPLARIVPDFAPHSFVPDLSRDRLRFPSASFEQHPARKAKASARGNFSWQEFWETVFKVLLAAGGISILALFLWAASKGGIRVPSSNYANHPLIIMKRGRR